MKSVIVIPARYASSRLPGKPLLRETGKYVIQHVYERALQAERSTDGIAEVAHKLDADVIINLQGDEPLIEPSSLDTLVELLQRHPEADVATLAVPITGEDQWRNPNCVKVVCSADGRALYFSRSPI